ncbi:MAG: LysM peptidoglycan-binding domain-containing protein, partial [Muribaculaceae bacterium]|nr:LysM peptidoglycan-binding domain-containing protein [Muribaculaceae bacterium]
KTYKVKKGETLSKIAKKNGISVTTLCKLNGLKKTSTLRVGQTLRVK